MDDLESKLESELNAIEFADKSEDNSGHDDTDNNIQVKWHTYRRMTNNCKVFTLWHILDPVKNRVVIMSTQVFSYRKYFSSQIADKKKHLKCIYNETSFDRGAATLKLMSFRDFLFECCFLNKSNKENIYSRMSKKT